MTFSRLEQEGHDDFAVRLTVWKRDDGEIRQSATSNSATPTCLPQSLVSTTRDSRRQMANGMDCAGLGEGARDPVRAESVQAAGD